ncbi:N-acetylglucosamine-6-phosphate deacetylase [Asticcacaulis benevestitus]|uniref:N-acetylglucosamine 6-phosphate deacetylase n=1 Tax=Asticcacaulis benevestitus DSM 16100 = ATCC BAA-896 TaxID=1121022 RepID=V4RTX2_9CAUL|nr:N-acetylglucosamine-6-phosphate deacetylase [Asticcacaulis benevestitus]ESQ94603.1 N-acetylglucosamine 6-phosphate deacetylase [Asticcacaulis benevestitus DSM 16100 = ATCC BAA-896]
MITSFTNAQIATPDGQVTTGTLTCEGETITAIGGSAPVGARVIDVQGGYLLPGFIDTQVNGGGGVLFNDETTAEGIAAIGKAHRAYGTTAFMPTLISDELSVIDAAMRATEDAIAKGVPGVLGIHIEGPFISTQRKGIHNAALFRTLDAESKALLKSLKRGKTLVTLAPENCTPEDIAELAQAGVILAAGHTNATYDTTVAALKAGVTGFTHLFNAMSPFTHRAPGVVGAALEDQTSYSGLIADGHHVDWAALRIALRTRPIDRFMLVTDAMPTVGSPTKTFVLNGMTIVVRDGVCMGPDGTLAGSDLDMATAVRNAVEHVGVSLGDAAIMAATAPANFLGLGASRGSLAVGQRADIVWLDKGLQVKGTFIGAKLDEDVAVSA